MATLIPKCASCGLTRERLLTCSNCQSVSYCDRSCQRAHWTKHKQRCQEIAAELKLHDEMNKTSKAIRTALAVGQHVDTVSVVSSGLPPNFHLKQQATIRFVAGHGFAAENTFKAFFDEIVAHRTSWYSFFEQKDNHQHAEHSCGILGTLATLYRQRGELEKCEAVLDVEDEVLKRYKDVSVGTERAQILCCDELAYKYELIRYNLSFQKKQYTKCVPIYRSLAAHELKYDYDEDRQNFLFMMPMFLDKNPSPGNLRRLTDTEVLRIVKAPLRMGLAL